MINFVLLGIMEMGGWRPGRMHGWRVGVGGGRKRPIMVVVSMEMGMTDDLTNYRPTIMVTTTPDRNANS